MSRSLCLKQLNQTCVACSRARGYHLITVLGRNLWQTQQKAQKAEDICIQSINSVQGTQNHNAGKLNNARPPQKCGNLIFDLAQFTGQLLAQFQPGPTLCQVLPRHRSAKTGPGAFPTSSRGTGFEDNMNLTVGMWPDCAICCHVQSQALAMFDSLVQK